MIPNSDDEPKYTSVEMSALLDAIADTKIERTRTPPRPDNRPNNIMIDPSLIVSDVAFSRVFSFIKEYGYAKQFFFPKSFADFLYQGNINREVPFVRFFLQRAYPSSTDKVKSTMEEHSNLIKPFEPSSHQREKYEEVYDAFMEHPPHGDKRISNVLFEEWVFLNEYSWIVSRSKKVFEKFIEAGAICLQFGKKTTETLIRKALKKGQNDYISTLDKCRFVGKWIATVIPSSFVFVDPYEAIAIGTASSVFLLFDPQTIQSPY